MFNQKKGISLSFEMVLKSGALDGGAGDDEYMEEEGEV